MSEQKHTPLEIKIEQVEGKLVPLECNNSFETDIGKRFVACWNACQGISTEALVGNPPGKGGVIGELVEACKGLDELCERFEQHDINCATQASGVGDEFAAMGCTCAILKAKRVLEKLKDGAE